MASASVVEEKSEVTDVDKPEVPNKDMSRVSHKDKPEAPLKDMSRVLHKNVPKINISEVQNDDDLLSTSELSRGNTTDEVPNEDMANENVSESSSDNEYITHLKNLSDIEDYDGVSVKCIFDVPHFDLFLQGDTIMNSVMEILNVIRPDWNPDDITFKEFSEGITNKLIGCFNSTCSSDGILIRVYGNNTELFIDRKTEARNFKLLLDAGYAPPVYATFSNGLAYKYVHGAVLTEQTVRSPSIYKLIARMMARFHKLRYDESIPCVPVIWSRCSKFINLLPEKFEIPNDITERFFSIVPEGLKTLRHELVLLQYELSMLESPVVFCHNDLLLANIIVSGDSVTFIDYEYGTYNYQAFDIGNHFDEFAGVTNFDPSLYPDKDLQWDWLRIYLEEYNSDIENYEATDEKIEKLYVQVNKFALSATFMWGVWSLVQSCVSKIEFDFFDYACLRLSDYFSKKGKLLKLADQ